jgi:hypothetical protein
MTSFKFHNSEGQLGSLLNTACTCNKLKSAELHYKPGVGTWILRTLSEFTWNRSKRRKSMLIRWVAGPYNKNSARNSQKAYTIAKTNRFMALRFWGSRSGVTNSSLFWDIMPCSPLKVNWRFGRTCHLILHGRRSKRARNQSKNNWPSGTCTLVCYSSNSLTRIIQATCFPEMSIAFFNRSHGVASQKTELLNRC